MSTDFLLSIFRVYVFYSRVVGFSLFWSLIIFFNTINGGSYSRHTEDLTSAEISCPSGSGAVESEDLDYKASQTPPSSVS